MANRICKHCGESIPDHRGRSAQFCNDVCRELARGKARTAHPRREASSRVGAANELRATAELLCEGWEVFRSVNPRCPCDLVAMRGEEMLRVEVKTGVRYAQDGQPVLPSTNGTRYDVLVVIMPDRRVIFRTAKGEPWSPE